MSMHRCNELLFHCIAAYVKGFPVNMKQPESLADYVRRVRYEKRLSLSDVQRNSGGAINGSYVSRIENAVVTNVTADKLKALARGLEVSEDEVFAVALGKSLNSEEAFDNELYVMFKGFEELSAEDKRALLETVRMLGAEIQRRRPRKKRRD